MPSLNRIVPSYFLVLFLLGSCQTALARTTPAHPVARLLSAPSDPTSLTRPRRVVAASTLPISATALREAKDIERRAFEMINMVRSQHGVAPLQWAPDLYRMARTHSANMGQQRFFSHESPDGLHPRDRARAVGIRHFRVLAENIAYNQSFEDPAASAVEQWMSSPGHRANILDAEFAQSAIGSFVAADGKAYLTQVFIVR